MKAIIETETLLKLRDKHKLASRLCVNSSSTTGEIFSDDEDDYDHANDLRGARAADTPRTVSAARSTTEGKLLASIGATMLSVETAATLLLPSAVLTHTNANERLLALFTKVYKVFVKLTRELVADKVTFPPDHFLRMARFASEVMAPKLQKLLNHLHKALDRQQADGAGMGMRSQLSKHAKLVPELIYQIEQWDLQLIKLAGVVKDPSEVRRFIKRTDARDFKIVVRGDADDHRGDEDNEEGEKERRKRSRGGAAMDDD